MLLNTTEKIVLLFCFVSRFRVQICSIISIIPGHFPLLPKAFSPRAEVDRVSTSTNRTGQIFSIINCAIRSPRLISNVSFPWLMGKGGIFIVKNEELLCQAGGIAEFLFLFSHKMRNYYALKGK